MIYVNFHISSQPHHPPKKPNQTKKASNQTPQANKQINTQTNKQTNPTQTWMPNNLKKLIQGKYDCVGQFTNSRDLTYPTVTQKKCWHRNKNFRVETKNKIQAEE